MAIKNYTSKVPSVRSLAEIQEELAMHGATKIMTDYEGGKATGITFGIEVNGATAGFRITADVDGVLAVFKKQNVKPDKLKNEILNCPNCGAVRTGAKCEYCGTVFEFEEEQLETVTLYADGAPFHTVTRRASSTAKEAAEAFRKFAEHL